MQKSSVVVGDAAVPVAGVAAEELAYGGPVAVILLVVFRENVGNARTVEFVWPAKADGVVRGGLATVVMLAINVSPNTLATLIGTSLVEDPPWSPSVGVAKAVAFIVEFAYEAESKATRDDDMPC